MSDINCLGLMFSRRRLQSWTTDSLCPTPGPKAGVCMRIYPPIYPPALSNTPPNQTTRFCQFPQEVTFELGVSISSPVPSTSSPPRIRQVQILSHQCKIATKIELFVACKSSPTGTVDECRWERLGYLSLDSNARSQFQARELKVSGGSGRRIRGERRRTRKETKKHINAPFNPTLSRSYLPAPIAFS